MKKIISFKKINSTQDYAKKIAGKSSSGTVIVAESQICGRGRFERGWSSQKGGLYFSIILKPKIDAVLHPDGIPELTLKMAAAIIDALKIKKYRYFVKPPNDIMISPKSEVRSPKYRKIAGILTESSVTCNKIDWIVVGVGVNINNKIPKGLKKIAVSLKEITGKNRNVRIIFREIIKKFANTLY